MLKARNLRKLLLLTSLWMLAGAAHAATPANTLLSNKAKMTYTGNPTGIEAAIDVTVTLVTANVKITPVFSAPTDQTKAENQSFTTTYTVYAQNNGLDTYALSSAVSTNNNVTSAGAFTATPTDPLAPTTTAIALGATALNQAVTSTGTTTILSVPADGNAADSQINGLKAGDTVVINDLPYTIAAITDNATGSSSITLGAPIPASTLPVGTGIYESQTFTVATNNVGAISSILLPASLVVTTSIDNGSDPAVSDPVEIFIVQISMTKGVRCISGCDESAGTNAFDYDVTDNSIDGGGANYFAGGVTAAPGGVLEYLITMTNPASTGVALTGAVLSDVLPTYTVYKPGSTYLNSKLITDEAGDGFTLSTTADDFGLVVGHTGVVGAEDDGVIASGTTVYVVYQITVN